MKANITTILLLVSMLAVTSSVVGKKDKNNNNGGLQMKFYRKNCRKLENIVQDITWGKVQDDATMAAKLLRLHYHDCFVRVRIYTNINTHTHTHIYIYIYDLYVNS